MQTIRLQNISITGLDTEILVNAANESLLHGSGVCGAIFRAAGPDRLQDACDRIGHCPTGSAVITPGFALCKYIIHAVGPIWYGGSNNEAKLLYSCYKASLDLVKENGCHTAGFPLISSGIYGYPKKEAWEIALRSVTDWFKENPEYDLDVKFAIPDKDVLGLGRDILSEIAPEMLQIPENEGGGS